VAIHYYYIPVRNALKIDGNVDDEERMHLLTSYKDCMLKKFRDNVKEAKVFRNNLKDFLLKGIISSSSNQSINSKDELDLVQANSTYYLCGYIVHTRASQISCDSCLDSLLTEENELPSDFYAAFITSMKSLGYLRFASVPMYYAFSKVERLLQLHFQSENAYLRDSFDSIISTVAENGIGGIPNICCSRHKEKTIPFLILEYIEIRYHIEAKRYKKDVLQKLKTKQPKLHKLSRMVV
jgi:hypothetical protein